jgi:FHA domain
VRDANALQRRRRLRLLRPDETATNGDANGSSQPVDPEEARAQLLNQCGGQSGLQLLIEVNGEAHARKVSLNRPCLLIGSDAQCDIRIKHPAVFPCHAYLQWIDGRLFCSGLDDAVSNSGWVGPKPMSLGPFRVYAPELEPLTGLPDPQVRNSELAVEIPQIQLKFVGVEQTDNLWPVDRRLTLIGRGAQCKLRLDHPNMPIVLASLVRTNGGCWLIDLSGSDTLFVNGQPISGVQSLDVGDKIQLGEFVAEVAAVPFTTKPVKQRPTPKPASVRELVNQHRTHLGTIKESFETVQYYLDTDHLDGLPELKTALQQYVLHVQKHHRELQSALERLAEPATVQS